MERIQSSRILSSLGRMRRQATGLGETLVNNIPDKRFVFIIFKELLKFNYEKTNNRIKTNQKSLNNLLQIRYAIDKLAEEENNNYDDKNNNTFS